MTGGLGPGGCRPARRAGRHASSGCPRHSSANLAASARSWAVRATPATMTASEHCSSGRPLRSTRCSCGACGAVVRPARTPPATAGRRSSGLAMRAGAEGAQRAARTRPILDEPLFAAARAAAAASRPWARKTCSPTCARARAAPASRRSRQRGARARVGAGRAGAGRGRPRARLLHVAMVLVVGALGPGLDVRVDTLPGRGGGDERVAELADGVLVVAHEGHLWAAQVDALCRLLVLAQADEALGAGKLLPPARRTRP